MESDTLQSNEYSDISGSTSSEKSSSDSSESESNGSDSKRKKPNAMQKRNAKTTSTGGSSAKKSCNATDFDTVSELMKSSLVHGLRILEQENDDHIEQIDNLRKKLNIVYGEKKALEQIVADTDEAKRNQKERFDDEKIKFLQNIAALQVAQRNEKEKSDEEKKMLEQQIAALEQNKTKKTCVYCQTILDPVVFCNSDCGL